MNYGRINAGDMNETFCMTVLALKMSRAANGVSELHGQVSREMWKPLYRRHPADNVPIGYITNGVHIGGWLNEKSEHFWSKHLGKEWQEHYLDPEFWEKAVLSSVDFG